jgi:uncharacterized membrane protein YhaH (DUF805 family)
MSLQAAIRSGFQNFANFKGRASRSAYWWWVLFSAIVQFASSGYSDTLSLIVSLVLVIPSLSLSWRRMHDSGHNGFWSIVPIVNLVFALTSSQQSENKYGPPPPPRSL